MDLGISGRSALVCGASRGLGFACTEALAAEGVSVVLASRNADALHEAAERIRQHTGQAARTVVADVATVDGRAAALSACPAPDILVTNAGGPPSKDFRELSLDDWQAALDANCLSAVELIRGTVDGMIDRGFGRIVNITSMTVRTPVQNLDLSNAARLALTGYVAGVARQVAASNVTINHLLPGTIETERIRALGDTANTLIAKVPAGRAQGGRRNSAPPARSCAACRPRSSPLRTCSSTAASVRLRSDDARGPQKRIVMRKPVAILGSAISFVVVRCALAGLVPLWITRRQFRDPFLVTQITQAVGVVLIVAGLPGLVDSIRRFAVEEFGTPAPVAPTQTLVVAGLYRHVRNPMYLSVLAIIKGRGLLFGDWRLLTDGA